MYGKSCLAPKRLRLYKTQGEFKMSKKIINLSLMKKLIVELESTMTEADRLREQVETHKPSINEDTKVECLIALNKALGLTAGILTEAGMLMGDLQHQMHGAAGASAKTDIMDQILGSLGGVGGPAGRGGTGTAN
jgi:hypothetical protein